jgi:hypothetical protein
LNIAVSGGKPILIGVPSALMPLRNLLRERLIFEDKLVTPCFWAGQRHRQIHHKFFKVESGCAEVLKCLFDQSPVAGGLAAAEGVSEELLDNALLAFGTARENRT